MSGQPEAEVITSLEDLFASREFGRLLPVLPERGERLLGRAYRGRPGRFRSCDRRGMLSPPPALPTAAAEGWRGHPARAHAVAALSGVTAVALVVAGLAAGTTHHPPSGLSALGSATPSEGGGIRGIRGGEPSPSTIGPGAPNLAATVQRPGAGANGPVARLTASTASPTPTSTATPRHPVVVMEVPAGTAVVVVPALGPSSTPPDMSTPAGSAQARTPGVANPLTPEVTSSTGTVSTVPSTAPSPVATGVPRAMPTTAPVSPVAGNLRSAVNAGLA